MILSTYNIVYILTNIFTLFVIQRFLNSFFQKRNCSALLSLGAYLMYFLATSCAYFVLNIPVVNLLTSWIALLLVSLTYEATPQKRLLYVTYIMMFMLIPEIIVGAATGYIHFSVFTSGNYSDSTGLVTTWLLKYCEALLIRNYKSTKAKQTISWISWASSILIPVVTLIQELILFSCNDLSKSKAIISIVLLFAVNVAFFYLYDLLSESYVRRSMLSLMEKENELYIKQCEIMQSSTEDLQAFRHDTNNQFIALSELLAAKRYDEAEEQLRELSHLTKKKIIYSTSGNVIVDGLINYKLQNAFKEDIKVKTEIAVPMQLAIDSTDLITVIGNLLDNALTAILKLEPDQRTLNFRLVYSRQRLIFRCSNPYNGELLTENGKIASTKTDKAAHGFGLSNITKSVEKYNGYMEIKTEDHTFTVDIIMYIPS